MLEKFLSNRLLVLYFIPFFFGSVSVLSFEPFNLTIVNFITLPLLFYFIVHINKKSKSVYRKKPYKKNLFIFGLLFGFGFYFCGVSWITNSLTFDDNFRVLIPFALILIPLFLSLFTALTILLIGPHLKFNFSSLTVFSGGIAFSDFLRGKLFTGFPWNLWAYSTNWATEILQILNFTGLYFYNLLVISVFTLPIIIFFRISFINKLLCFFLASLVILSSYVFGSYEINKNREILKNSQNSIFIKVISPNFELEYGLSKKEIEDRFKKLIRYSNPVKNQKTLFVWPEGVFSGYNFNEIQILREFIRESFSKEHIIIFGANTLDKKTGNLFNSMFVVDNNFEIIQRYDKKKLVPFGEFLPFEKLLSKFGLKKITEGHGSFSKGKKNSILTIKELNILPLICYEVIFTELIQKSKYDTNLIINISEDAWFGKSVGPDQHFAKSIFRAIENNTFFVRSANQGVSAIIDNKGNIIKQLNRNEAGSIELEIPLINSKKNKNDLIFFILLTTYLFIFFIYKGKNAKK